MLRALVVGLALVGMVGCVGCGNAVAGALEPSGAANVRCVFAGHELYRGATKSGLEWTLFSGRRFVRPVLVGGGRVYIDDAAVCVEERL
jgi:hypothetical protein